MDFINNTILWKGAIYMGETHKPMKLFISHSSQDLEFVQPLVELFEHIGLSPKNMFCSSVTGYNVRLDSNIYDFLIEQFQNYNLRVIFVLSGNYYNSPVCLNEMGAAWVLQKKYTSILIPQFDYKDVKGVIDQMRISIKLDSDKSDLKSRLNELKDMLADEFDLGASLSFQNVWERHRDEFVAKVSSTEVSWKYIRELRDKNRPLEEWVIPLKMLIEVNPSSYDAMYMLGIIYAQNGDFDKAVEYLRMTARLSKNNEIKSKANARLNELGYII